MQKATYRKFQHIMVFATISVLAFSFYIEYVNQLKPCPLCFMQRACIFLFGFVCMLGMGVSSLVRAKTFTTMQCILTGLGLYFASRQLWLQSSPIEYSGQCLPGLEAMLHYFSWDMLLKSFFWGTSDCSQVDWKWLGITIPLWSSFYFIAMFAVSIYVYVKLSLGKQYNTKF